MGVIEKNISDADRLFAFYLSTGESPQGNAGAMQVLAEAVTGLNGEEYAAARLELLEKGCIMGKWKPRGAGYYVRCYRKPQA